MIINQAELKGIYVNSKQLPTEGVPEIALVGRSNVGKSSLINTITNRKKLAKSSSTPGKTRTINFYSINNQWHIVDLPGYGYAKVSKNERAKWKTMVENYIKKREQLRGIIQLIDARHEPMENDILMKQWLSGLGIPILIVATKIDKISRGARRKSIDTIKKALYIDSDDLPLLFSAETGEGKEDIKTAIEELLSYQDYSVIAGSDPQSPPSTTS